MLTVIPSANLIECKVNGHSFSNVLMILYSAILNVNLIALGP